MKRKPIFLKALAVFLSLSLGLPAAVHPEPVEGYALRQSGLEENSAKGEILKALGHSTSAAGAEERMHLKLEDATYNAVILALMDAETGRPIQQLDIENASMDTLGYQVYRNNSNPPPGMDFSDLFIIYTQPREEAQQRRYDLTVVDDYRGTVDYRYVKVVAKTPPAAGVEELMEREYDGLTDIRNGEIADRRLLEVLKPGHRQIVVRSAGTAEISRIFRMPGIQLQAGVVDAVGERNVLDIQKGSQGTAPFWEEWDLRAGDVILLDLPAGEEPGWLPAKLPRGVAVLNLPGVQAAGLKLSELASMVDAALRRGGILPRVEDVLQAGAEQMVLDLGT